MVLHHQVPGELASPSLPVWMTCFCGLLYHSRPTQVNKTFSDLFRLHSDRHPLPPALCLHL